MYMRDDKGFTLVEIMIVVIVIGLLTSLMLPNFIKVREKAQMYACKANLHQLDSSKKLIAIDEGKQTGDAAGMDDIVPDYIRTTPTCPSGGTYTIDNIGTSPTCTISGHEI